MNWIDQFWSDILCYSIIYVEGKICMFRRLVFNICNIRFSSQFEWDLFSICCIMLLR